MKSNKYAGLCIGGPLDGKMMERGDPWFDVVNPPWRIGGVPDSVYVDYAEETYEVVTYVFVEKRDGKGIWMLYSDWAALPWDEQLIIGRLAR